MVLDNKPEKPAPPSPEPGPHELSLDSAHARGGMLGGNHPARSGVHLSRDELLTPRGSISASEFSASFARTGRTTRTYVPLLLTKRKRLADVRPVLVAHIARHVAE